MKQHMELFEFFIDKVPIQRVDELKGSQILTNFSMHFTTSSIMQNSDKEEMDNSDLSILQNHLKPMESTISDSQKYKDIFLNIHRKKQDRRQSITKVWKR